MNREMEESCKINGPIEMQMQDLEYSLQDLSQVLGVMESKLNPVLAPVLTTDEMCMASSPSAPKSELSSRLEVACGLVKNKISRIQELLQRLEL